MNLTNKFNVFIDESGDPNLDTEVQGASSLYVLCAIIVHETEMHSICECIEKISATYFGGTEIKSSGIGKNLKRREKIITEVLNLNFKFAAIVVNKKEIYKDSGLKFKESFLKYICKTLLSRLNIYLPNVDIIADQHGHNKFMDSFKKYIGTKIKPSLFGGVSFNFADSKQNRIIQLADLLAGTLNRLFSGKDDKRLAKLFFEKKYYIDHWPPKVPSNIPNSEAEAWQDTLVAEASLDIASRFIHDNDGSNDERTKAQVETLRYLISYYLQESCWDYVYSDKIIEYLCSIGIKYKTKTSFFQNVIAKLRDSGVIIASKNSGYKIPYCVKDLSGYVKQVNNLVGPYLRRLEEARTIFLAKSNNNLDIVNSSAFPILYNYFKNKDLPSD